MRELNAYEPLLIFAAIKRDSLFLCAVQSPPISIPSDFSDSDSCRGRGLETAGSTPSPPPQRRSTVSPGLPEALGEERGGATPPTLQFWYVNHAGELVLEKDRATVTFDGKGWSMLQTHVLCTFFPALEIITVGFLIKCKLVDLESSSALYTLDETRFVCCFLLLLLLFIAAGRLRGSMCTRSLATLMPRSRQTRQTCQTSRNSTHHNHDPH